MYLNIVVVNSELLVIAEISGSLSWDICNSCAAGTWLTSVYSKSVRKRSKTNKRCSYD